MGMDGVELLMDIENTFQITISNSEAENSITVGDIYKLVLQKIDYSKNNQCKSQVLFYKMREIFSRHCNYEMKSISPKTKLNDLFEKKSVREKWSSIQDELFIKIPDLTRPKWLNKLLNWTTTFLVVVTIILLFNASNSNKYILMIFASISVAVIYLAWVLTRHFKIHHRYPDLRGLIMGTLPINIKTLDLSIKDKNDVLHVLRHLIHENSGEDLEKITLDAKIVKDLGIN